MEEIKFDITHKGNRPDERDPYAEQDRSQDVTTTGHPEADVKRLIHDARSISVSGSIRDDDPEVQKRVENTRIATQEFEEQRKKVREEKGRRAADEATQARKIIDLTKERGRKAQSLTDELVEGGLEGLEDVSEEELRRASGF